MQNKEIVALTQEIKRLRKYINKLLPQINCEACNESNKTLDDWECIDDTGKCISCHQEEYNQDEN